MIKVTIFCYGECGRSVTLRKSKVQKADYYLCNTTADGIKCLKKLPPISTGKARHIEINAAGSFWGYSDRFLDKETAFGIVRARAILADGLRIVKERQYTQEVLHTPQEVLASFIEQLHQRIIEEELKNRNKNIVLDCYCKPRLEQYLQLESVTSTHTMIHQEQTFPEHSLHYVLLEDELKIYELDLSVSSNWGNQVILWEACYAEKAMRTKVCTNGGWRDNQIDVLSTLDHISYDVPHLESEDEQSLLSEEEIYLLEKRFRSGGDLFIDIALAILPYQKEW